MNDGDKPLKLESSTSAPVTWQEVRENSFKAERRGQLRNSLGNKNKRETAE